MRPVDPGYGAGMDQEHEGHAEPVLVASFGTRGEAEVAEAKLRAYGIDAALDDLIEGGSIPVEGETGVSVLVHADDADDARRILGPEDSSVVDGPTGE